MGLRPPSRCTITCHSRYIHHTDPRVRAMPASSTPKPHQSPSSTQANGHVRARQTRPPCSFHAFMLVCHAMPLSACPGLSRCLVSMLCTNKVSTSCSAFGSEAEAASFILSPTLGREQKDRSKFEGGVTSSNNSVSALQRQQLLAIHAVLTPHRSGSCERRHTSPFARHRESCRLGR